MTVVVAVADADGDAELILGTTAGAGSCMTEASPFLRNGAGSTLSF